MFYQKDVILNIGCLRQIKKHIRQHSDVSEEGTSCSLNKAAFLSYYIMINKEQDM